MNTTVQSYDHPTPFVTHITWWSDEIVRQIEAHAETNAEAYQRGHPFPHIVIDDFLPENLLTYALEVFPGPAEISWTTFKRKRERKLAYSDVGLLPPALRDLMHFLNGPTVLRALERLTGIQNLISDPYFFGGGLHQIERDGMLNIHADFNLHETLQLDRRLNLLLYLNKDWKDEYGGNLELWDPDMKKCVKSVKPIFNRCVVFSTTSDALHGHPHPLTCPPERTRKSIATYYYTKGRPPSECRDAHTTAFKDLPPTTIRGKVVRLAKDVGREIVPPFALTAFRAIKNARRQPD